MSSCTTLRILVVEDNADHADLILAALGESPVKVVVTHVGDGEEALDYLFGRRAYSAADSAPTPELVLLDLHLPKVDGIDVLREVRACDRTAGLPVIVLSTSDAERDKLAARAHRCTDYLVKPAEYASLSQLLSGVLNRWADRQPAAAGG